MIRLGIGNLTKIGFFSRIPIVPAAAGQILSNRKFSDKIPDKNSINSIIDEIKHGVNKLKSEMGRSIVAEKDYKNKNVPLDWKPHYKTLRISTMDYRVDEEPNLRMMKIKLKQDENGNKSIHIFQNEEEDDNIWYPNLRMLSMRDAYRVLDAMQLLEFKWPENYAKALRHNKATMNCKQWIDGTFACDYQLGIHLRPNKPLDFRMEAIHKDFHNKMWKLRGPIPIDVFYWLKAQMAQIVEEYEEEFGDDEEEDENEDDFDEDEY